MEPALSLAAIWRDLAAFTRDTAQVGQIGTNAGEGKDDVMAALFEKETHTMNVQFQPQFRTAEGRLPFECIALVLQGGGALGAYQAGVYEALAEANINPDWVAGVSIGAVNSAIIAGNEPAERVGKLRTFWQEITANPLLDWAAAADALTPKGSLPRALFNQLSAIYASSRAPRAFSRFGSPLPGCTRTALLRPRAFTKPSS